MGGRHRWVLGGILAGALVGTALNFAYEPEARTEVLGIAPTAEQVANGAREVASVLSQRLRGTFLGGALYGLAQIFMNLLRMIVIPLVFFSLVGGVVGMGGARRVGRVGAKTAAWYLSTSLAAIATGLLWVNTLNPGTDLNVVIPTEAREAKTPESFWNVIANMIPSNIVESMAEFDMFGIIFFALLFGIFLVGMPDAQKKPVTDFVDSATEVMMRMTGFVISLAPVGVGCLVATAVATSGPQIFVSLIAYVLTVALALGVHVVLTVPGLVWVITRRNPYRYMKAMSPALLTAFSTASSSGTLAFTMERARSKAGISNRITSFVLPLGATVNMDGTALYECVTVLFIAQLHASGHPEFAPLGFGAQLTVVALALAVSIGAAGIPHAGLVMMVIILDAVNLPLEYTAVVWAVDRVLDMARTLTNVWSDSAGALVVGHLEGEIDDQVLFADSPTTS